MSARSRDPRRFAAADWQDGDDCLVDPVKAGWNRDPNTWRLHYRVSQPITELTHPETIRARIYLANMPAERRAQLEREWNGEPIERSCA